MKKTITKRLRLNEKEWEQIEPTLQEKNITFSQYAINAMLKNKYTRKEKHMQDNKELILQLARWGNNLNQVAKHLNTTNSGLDRVGLEMLKRIEIHLQELRAKHGC